MLPKKYPRGLEDSFFMLLVFCIIIYINVLKAFSMLNFFLLEKNCAQGATLCSAFEMNFGKAVGKFPVFSPPRPCTVPRKVSLAENI